MSTTKRLTCPTVCQREADAGTCAPEVRAWPIARLLDYSASSVSTAVPIARAGWLAVVHAGLHADQVNTLTIGGAPIDTHAGQSAIQEWTRMLARRNELGLYRRLSGPRHIDFTNWFEWTQDLPGAFYLWIVFYLWIIEQPEQVWALPDLVSTSAEQIELSWSMAAVASCSWVAPHWPSTRRQLPNILSVTPDQFRIMPNSVTSCRDRL